MNYDLDEYGHECGCTGVWNPLGTPFLGGPYWRHGLQIIPPRCPEAQAFSEKCANSTTHVTNKPIKIMEFGTTYEWHTFGLKSHGCADLSGL